MDTKPSRSEESAGESRRSFMTKAAATAIAAGCFGSLAGVREALAMAARQGKPLLTPDNLNTYIETHFNALLTSSRFAGRAARNERLRLAQAVKSDPLGFLQQHFTVTPEQAYHIGNLSAEDRAVLHQAIDRAIRDGIPLHYSEGSDGAEQPPTRGGTAVPQPNDPKTTDGPPTHQPSGGATASVEAGYQDNKPYIKFTISWPWKKG